MFFSRKQKTIPVQTPESVKIAELLARCFSLEKALAETQLEKTQLETKLKTKELIDINLGDPSPMDSARRAEYVAKVAGLHKEILEPKLKYMISNVHNLLEEENSRDQDLALRGTAYAFREVLRWGTLMINEQIANQMGQNPSTNLEDNKPKSNEN